MINKDLFGEVIAVGDYVLVSLPQRAGDKPRLGKIVSTDPKYKTLQYLRIDLKKEKFQRMRAEMLVKLSEAQMTIYMLTRK